MKSTKETDFDKQPKSKGNAPSSLRMDNRAVEAMQSITTTHVEPEGYFKLTEGSKKEIPTEKFLGLFNTIKSLVVITTIEFCQRNDIDFKLRGIDRYLLRVLDQKNETKRLEHHLNVNNRFLVNAQKMNLGNSIAGQGLPYPDFGNFPGEFSLKLDCDLNTLKELFALLNKELEGISSIFAKPRNGIGVEPSITEFEKEQSEAVAKLFPGLKIKFVLKKYREGVEIIFLDLVEHVVKQVGIELSTSGEDTYTTNGLNFQRTAQVLGQLNLSCNYLDDRRSKLGFNIDNTTAQLTRTNLVGNYAYLPFDVKLGIYIAVPEMPDSISLSNEAFEYYNPSEESELIQRCEAFLEVLFRVLRKGSIYSDLDFEKTTIIGIVSLMKKIEELIIDQKLKFPPKSLIQLKNELMVAMEINFERTIELIKDFELWRLFKYEQAKVVFTNSTNYKIIFNELTKLGSLNENRNIKDPPIFLMFAHTIAGNERNGLHGFNALNLRGEE